MKIFGRFFKNKNGIMNVHDDRSNKEGGIPWNKGKKMSDEFKQKVSESQKGKQVSEETRLKLSQAAKGRKHSEETKQKIRESCRKKQIANLEVRRQRVAEEKRRVEEEIQARINYAIAEERKKWEDEMQARIDKATVDAVAGYKKTLRKSKTNKRQIKKHSSYPERTSWMKDKHWIVIDGKRQFYTETNGVIRWINN